MQYIGLFKRFKLALRDKGFATHFMEEGLWKPFGFVMTNFGILNLIIFIRFIFDRGVLGMGSAVDYDEAWQFIFFIHYLQYILFFVGLGLLITTIISLIISNRKSGDLSFGDNFKVACYAVTVPNMILFACIFLKIRPGAIFLPLTLIYFTVGAVYSNRFITNYVPLEYETYDMFSQLKNKDNN